MDLLTIFIILLFGVIVSILMIKILSELKLIRIGKPEEKIAEIIGTKGEGMAPIGLKVEQYQAPKETLEDIMIRLGRTTGPIIPVQPKRQVWNKGRPMSEETKNKIRETRLKQSEKHE